MHTDALPTSAWTAKVAWFATHRLLVRHRAEVLDFGPGVDQWSGRSRLAAASCSASMAAPELARQAARRRVAPPLRPCSS